MSGAFSVDPQELKQHSSTIDSIADSVEDCKTASDEEGVGGLVYGIIFDPTALPLLSMAKDHYASMITSAAEAGHGIAAALKSNADVYDTIDGDLKSHFGSLLGDVEATGNG